MTGGTSADLRYGVNPHQRARVAPVGGSGWPLRVVSGEPSYLNLLDALTGWQLVSEAATVSGRVAAASVKHASPAGVALDGPLDETATEVWRPPARPGAATSAYLRARDADPKSSFGDVIAVSAPVDAELAAVLRGLVSDVIIAPGYEAGAVRVLAAKKGGRFTVLEADPAFVPPARETREVFGLRFEQDRDDAALDGWLPGARLPAAAASDAVLGLAAVRYTQSNSVALMAGGMSLAVAAGQQNRVDCVRLAAAKAAIWWLRRHPAVRDLPVLPGQPRQDRLNWQIRLAAGELPGRQQAEFAALFPGTPMLTPDERASWLGQLTGLTLVSDGYLPFSDNIDEAARIGVRYVVEPGGSVRSDDVARACADYGITLVQTGLRLFRH